MKKCKICKKNKKNISFGYTGTEKDLFCRQCKAKQENPNQDNQDDNGEKL